MGCKSEHINGMIRWFSLKRLFLPLMIFVILLMLYKSISHPHHCILKLAVTDLSTTTEKPRETILTDVSRRAFELTERDVEREFQKWDQKKSNMKDYLWDNFQVVILPIANMPSDQKTLGQIFRQSIVRHVSIFYGDYQRAGGKGSRQFPIPECSEIGLGRDDNEASSKLLDSLAGSQGDIKFKHIPYYDDDHRGVFITEPDGSVKMVTKYFVIREKDKDGKKQNQETAEQIARRDRKNKEKSRKNYLRELAALKTFNHPNIVHGVCTIEARLQIVYPLLRGGDLVPLGEDKLGFTVTKAGGRTGFSETLNPDQTFLPRFANQLVSAVAHMHQKGFVHLDLKPENFVVAGPDRKFIRPRGSPELEAYHLVLIDFGLSEVENKLTDECLKAGTEVTMAPEQVMCTAGVGFGTDWWGVAAGLYRVRVFWEPSISEKDREDALFAQDPQWGHVILPFQKYFAAEFSNLLTLMLKPHPDERLFDEDLKKLTDHPYLKLGQS